MDQKKGAELPHLSETLVEPDPEDQDSTTLELDELWSFVLKKVRKRWIWIALCRRTRQVVASAVGDRSKATCRKLWEAIAPAYQSAHSYSDFWEAYAAVIPAEQHTSVGIRIGQAAHVERFNNTSRQRLARLVRQTLSFSKSVTMHEVCLHLFFHRYNIARAAIFN